MFMRKCNQPQGKLHHDLWDPNNMRKDNGTIRNIFIAWWLCLSTATKLISKVDYSSFLPCYRLSPTRVQNIF